MPEPKSLPFLEISLIGSEDPLPSLLDITSFLYDFNLLYELIRLGTDESYDAYTFANPFVWTRNGRPLHPLDRLRVVQLRHESPIALLLVVAAIPSAIGAVWGMLQIAEKINNWGLNRELLELQKEKLQKELYGERENSSRLLSEEQISERLRTREALPYVSRTADRLSHGAIRVNTIDTRVVQLLPAPKEE